MPKLPVEDLILQIMQEAKKEAAIYDTKVELLERHYTNFKVRMTYADMDGEEAASVKFAQSNKSITLMRLSREGQADTVMEATGKNLFRFLFI